MLLSLHVKNLALIEEEEVSFTDGLNIMTGETGAGKSIIIGSVNLALGAKADKALIRTGEEYALIEMVFSLDNDRQRKILSDMDIQADEEDILLIKRKIYPGRSQCTVSGETVTLSQLREIAEALIDVYGQRENQRLLKKDAQLAVIDEFAGDADTKLRKEIKEAHHAYLELLHKWNEDDLDPASLARETDLIAYEVKEIEEAELREGEDEELEKEYCRLSNFRRINEAVQIAGSLNGGSSEDDAASQIERALRSLNQIEGLDENLDGIAAQLADIDSLLSDFGRALSDYMDDMSFDPAEFQRIEERLNLINHLKDKYGASLEKIQAALESRQKRLEELSDYDAARAKLEKDVKASKETLLALCEKLSGIRRAAADDFTEKLTEALMDLNFNQVVLKIDLKADLEHPTANGYDDCQFYISMNPGESPRPLDQIASGGELSRIMLALKTVFAGKDDIHTFIFDEIDAGISGQTAWKVSQKLGKLSKDHQIICITHLPQIAAMEDSHYMIAKETDGNRTVTHIRRLDEEASTRELGRLLGTTEVTEAVIANARELKNQALESKK